jgi:general secretion pathway protein B
MSFILDALKKSEAERQRQQVPGLMDSGMRARKRRLPAWAIVICILLGINVLILAAMLLRQQTPAAPPAPPPPSAAPAPANPAPHFSPMDSSPVYAPEIPVDEPDTTARATAPAAPAARATRAAAENTAQDDEVLPDISQVSVSDAQSLPDLHLDVHVYATKSADRFVYINMRKYREGAVVQDGLTVERIRRDGVVLNYQGLRFLLPRR